MRDRSNEKPLDPTEIRLLRGGREYPVTTAENRSAGVVFGLYRGKTVLIYRQNKRTIHYAVIRGGGSFWVQAFLKLSPVDRFSEVVKAFSPTNCYEKLRVIR